MQQIHTFLNRSDIILLTWSGIVSILCITSQGADMIGKEAEAKALNGFYQKAVAKNLIPLRKVTAKLLPPERQTKVLPYLWHWADLRRMVYRAGELVIIERGDFFVVPPGPGMSSSTRATAS